MISTIIDSASHCQQQNTIRQWRGNAHPLAKWHHNHLCKSVFLSVCRSTDLAVTDLETIDLSKSWQNSDPGLFNYIAKPWNASDPADYPPYLNEGASFSNGESLFFYEGYASECTWDCLIVHDI
jgi:hypothetical protein